MGLFSSSKIKIKGPLEPAWQTKLRETLGTSAEPGATARLKRAGEAYPGELTAGLSEYEETGLGELGKYLATELPTESPLYKATEEELTKTLTGGYEPATSDYYQAFRTNLLRELQKAKDRLAASTSGRDLYYGGGRVQEERQLEETALANLAQTMAGLSEAERSRRLTAVPLAQSILGFGETAPIARITAAEQLGALPRLIEQTGLSAEYEEWIRQLQDLGLPLETAIDLAKYKPEYYTQAYAPSEFSQVASSLGPLLGGIGGIGGLGALTSALTPGSAAMAMGGLAPLVSSLQGLGGLALAALSDIRAKENIESIENALDKVTRLDGKTFSYKSNANLPYIPIEGRHAGIIAQDLEKVLPEGVVEVNSFKFVRLDAIIGLLVNAVKELNKKLNEIMPVLN